MSSMVAQQHHVENRTWTVLSLLNWGSEYLAGREFESPRLNVELLLAETLGCSRIQLYSSFDKPLEKGEVSTFRQLFQRRLAREPLQYIRGKAEFFSEQYIVNRDVLIPRPETEILVERVIELCQRQYRGAKTVRMLDVGTGCGCIAISIARRIENAQVLGFDVSDKAVAVAQRNLALNRLEGRVKFIVLDLFAPLKDAIRAGIDIVVSNPPYVSKEEFERLMPEIRDFEPRSATCDEDDGFRFHRRIADLSGSVLKSEGWLFLEVGHNQSERVREILRGQGMRNVNTFSDYVGFERVVTAQR